MKIITVFSLTFLFSCLLSPHCSAASLSAGQFLSLGAGARELGMGGASVAVTQDVNSIYWNPAGLSHLSQKQWGITHTEPFVDTTYNFLAFALPTQEGVWGFHVLSLRSGSQQGRKRNGEKSADFSAEDFSAGFTYSSSLGQFTTAGVHLSILQSRISQSEANGFSFDIGCQQTLMLGTPLNLGLAIRNLGSSLQYQRQKYNLPSLLALGLGKELIRGLMLVGEYQRSFHNEQNQFLAGAELRVAPRVSMRGGYTFLSSHVATSQTDSVLESLGRFNGGLGLQLSKVSLDYSFVPVSGFGQSHRFTLISRF